MVSEEVIEETVAEEVIQEDTTSSTLEDRPKRTKTVTIAEPTENDTAEKPKRARTVLKTKPKATSAVKSKTTKTKKKKSGSLNLKDIVVAAVCALDNSKGASFVSIKKWILDNHDSVRVDMIKHQIRVGLTKALKDGLVRPHKPLEGDKVSLNASWHLRSKAKKTQTEKKSVTKKKSTTTSKKASPKAVKSKKASPKSATKKKSTTSKKASAKSATKKKTTTSKKASPKPATKKKSTTPKKASSKSSKSKITAVKPNDGGKYSLQDIVLSAIAAIGDTKGASYPAIKAWVLDNVDSARADMIKHHVRLGLTKALANNLIYPNKKLEDGNVSFSARWYLKGEARKVLLATKSKK